MLLLLGPNPGPGRVWVLTGPNRAGKTTYVRAVGLTQVLFQAGMYAPASSARLSPADTILTHFPGQEEARPGLGRLDTEAERLAAIFHQATPRSLILLNEALSGTSALEALDLARGLVRGLRLLGARTIYVTHLHELGNYVDDINATTPGELGGHHPTQRAAADYRFFDAETVQEFAQVTGEVLDCPLADRTGGATGATAVERQESIRLRE